MPNLERPQFDPIRRINVGRCALRGRRRQAFTLVEMMIVVVAMAIIAGAVIPQLEEAVEDSRQSTMLTSLHQMQTILERYKMEHDGRSPVLVSESLPQLLGPTDKQGNSNPGAPPVFGPYLYEIPTNPLNDSSAIHAATTIPPEAEKLTGWIYDASTGQVWAGLNRGGS
jgi:prepilin-type N-terminal cleavage/methylation domain-containing protein